MSICNCYVTPDMALVAVDTKAAELRQGKQPRYLEAQKAMIHGDVLVASRGGLGLPQMLHGVFIEACQFWRTDEALAQLPSLLAHAQGLHATALSTADGTPDKMAMQHEIYLVGWSERLNRIKAVCATQRPHGWQIEEISSWCAAPGIDSSAGEQMSTQTGMKALASRQIEAFREVDPRAPIGGELILYQIMRDGIIVRSMGRIG